MVAITRRMPLWRGISKTEFDPEKFRAQTREALNKPYHFEASPQVNSWQENSTDPLNSPFKPFSKVGTAGVAVVSQASSIKQELTQLSPRRLALPLGIALLLLTGFILWQTLGMFSSFSGVISPSPRSVQVKNTPSPTATVEPGGPYTGTGGPEPTTPPAATSSHKVVPINLTPVPAPVPATCPSGTICQGTVIRAFGPTTVGLGTAASFAVLAGSAITNTGSPMIIGFIGSYPTVTITGFPPVGTVNGTNPIGLVMPDVKTALTNAYNDAAGRTPATTIPTELGGTTLIPGVYNSAAGTFGITGTLTLNGQGDPNAVFIFQMASTLITASASNVVLTGSARSCNVFWQVGSSATLGTYSTLRGNLLALTSITVTTGVAIDGRLLARNGAVTLDNISSLTVPSC